MKETSQIPSSTPLIQSVIEVEQPDRDSRHWALLRDHAVHCMIMAIVTLSLAEFLELTA